jgi:hypothetical protein
MRGFIPVVQGDSRDCEQGEGWAFRSLPIDDEERSEDGDTNQGVLINIVWCQGRNRRGCLGLGKFAH